MFLRALILTPASTCNVSQINILLGFNYIYTVNLNHMQIKQYLLFLCFLVLSPGLRASNLADSILINKIKSIAVEVGKGIAPDRRTAVYNFKLQPDATSIEIESTVANAAELLKQKFKQAGLQVAVTQNLLPAANLNNKVYGVASLSVANNRKEPSHAAEMMTQLLMGTPVEILKKERGYFLVRSPDQYISWVEDAAVAEMDAATFGNWQSAKKLVYTADYGYAYATPNETGLRVSDLVSGNIVKYVGQEKGFYKVAYPDQRIAFIKMKDAIAYEQFVAMPNPDATKIINTAKTLLGVPYLWGGTSIKGVDCSGFTKTSFFLNGLVIPRDASQQALVGESIDIFEADTVNFAKSMKNLKAGDLLFFAAGKGKSANPRITHVAIYMENGEFIQAAGLVRINSLNPAAANYSATQALTMVSARRMLNSVGKPEISRINQHPSYKTLKNEQ